MSIDFYDIVLLEGSKEQKNIQMQQTEQTEQRQVKAQTYGSLAWDYCWGKTNLDKV